MRIIRVDCAACGIPLEIPASQAKTTCSFCQAGLHVRDFGEKKYTKPSQGHVDTPRLPVEVTKLDRRWFGELQEFMRVDVFGGQHLPSRRGAFTAAAIAGSIMAFVIIRVLSSGIDVGAGLLLPGLILGSFVFRTLYDVERYRRARRDFESDVWCCCANPSWRWRAPERRAQSSSIAMRTEAQPSSAMFVT